MIESTLKQPENEQKSSISYIRDIVQFKKGEVTFPHDHIWYHQINDKYEFLHVHDCIEFGICTQGSGVWHVNGKTLTFNGPTYSLIMPGVWHSAHSTDSKTSIWKFLYLKDSDLLLNYFLNGESLLSKLKNQSFIVNKKNDPVMFDLIDSFITISSQPMADKEKILSNLLKTILLIKCGEEENKNPIKADLTFLLPAINFINSHYMEKIDLDYLAELCCCSKSSLRRYFLQATGLSPYQYIENVRINISKDMLRGKKKIVDVAIDCGYPSISCFNKAFKKMRGITPKEYQKKHNVK